MKFVKLLVVLTIFFNSFAFASKDFRSISSDEYTNKMKAAWLGQIIGVTWGSPTEFKYNGRLIPESHVPKWKPEMINQGFGQDDLYVEMTFLKTLEDYGYDVSIRQCGIDFANSKYSLWHANYEGRFNLRRGIAPPDCSHPKFNPHSDDIDYQIEADFSGIIAPGMINVPIQLGEKFGRLVNYGDGVYGGQFVGAMYSEAFFENNMEQVVLKGLTAIPAESQYYECIVDVLDCWKKYPEDWKKTWQVINDKYHNQIKYRQSSCDLKKDFNIDAKLNGAYIVIGLLYGDGDIEKTVKISMMCGQDSDCNPSNAAGILATSMGFDKLPAKFKQIDLDTKFSYTDYNFTELIDVCGKLAKQILLANGAGFGVSAAGSDFGIYFIPNEKPVLKPVEQSYNPKSLAGTWYSDEEMTKIKEKNFDYEYAEPAVFAIKRFAPGWKIINCGPFMNPGMYPDWHGHTTILLTHPMSREVPCSLIRNYDVPVGKKTTLHFVVGHFNNADFQLIVKINGKVVVDKIVGPETCENYFLEENIDLTAYAGQKIEIEMQNKANGWSSEAALWDVIEIVSK